MLPCLRSLFPHVCRRVTRYVATLRRLGRFLSRQGYLRAKVYVLQVGNLVVARAGWMDAEEERSEMKVEVNIEPSDVSLSLNRYCDFSY